MPKKIIVASQNPAKIKAALDGFTRMFPDEVFEIEGVNVPSGVTDQPMDDAETYQGAFNRASNARKAAPDADYWIGIEGGLEAKGDELESFGWMVIHGVNGVTGKARTATFFLPPRVAELIRQGKELGEADDIVFKKQNSKQANGAPGLLTGDVITRTDYCSDAVVFALVPFKNPELFPK